MAAKRLLDWYDQKGRDLPWRETSDAYRVLVSEIMAQQTQIARVLPFFEHWLIRFPDWRRLAKAEVAEVIRAWSGLGYNRRALTLQNIAKQVVERGLPASETEWLELKGVGPYTAAALTVFALGQRAVPIDTNIRRVTGRWLLGVPLPELSHDRHLRTVLAPMVGRLKRFADFFQALFDLGATVCVKK
ncbi:MAG TPA: A/G-specific adenine glycosylase, partial [Candidatus Ozemobacteraceae bacterium]|nr:A/G-specific adenine glycosylase [Candidatus Ozemobacteraceae bacterium]